jgi:hypothetical protein
MLFIRTKMRFEGVLDPGAGKRKVCTESGRPPTLNKNYPMTPRIYLFLALGVLPLGAQSSMDSSDKLDPDRPSTVAPATPPGAATLRPGITQPTPGEGAPQLPAEPVVTPKLSEFTVSPGTVREGMAYKDDLKTIVTLTAPATKVSIYHIVSSDPVKVVSGDITLDTGQTSGAGGLQINWKSIKRSCQVRFKAFNDDNPEIILEGRIYLDKKML